jgi:hypothetical protein
MKTLNGKLKAIDYEENYFFYYLGNIFAGIELIFQFIFTQLFQNQPYYR